MKHFIPLHHDTTTSTYRNNQGNWNGRGNRGGHGHRRGRGNRNNRGNNQNFNRRYRHEHDIDYDAIDNHVLATEDESPYPWPTSHTFYSSPKGHFRNSRHSGSDEECNSGPHRNGLKRQRVENPNRSFPAESFYSRRTPDQYSLGVRDGSLSNHDTYSRHDQPHSYKRSDNWPSSPKRHRPPEDEAQHFRKHNYHNERTPKFTPKRQFEDRGRFQSSTPLSRGQSLVSMSQNRLHENTNGGRQNSTPHYSPWEGFTRLRETPTRVSEDKGLEEQITYEEDLTLANDNYGPDRHHMYNEQHRRNSEDRRHDRSFTQYDSEGRSTSGSEKSGYSPNERLDDQGNSPPSYNRDTPWRENHGSSSSRFNGNNRSSDLRPSENHQSSYNESSSDAKRWQETTSPNSSVSGKLVGRPVSSIKGFKNFANTCYINSVLQALFGIPMVVKALLEFDKQFSERLQDGVLSSVLRLLKERHQNPKRADSFEPLLRRVKEAVVKKTKSFEGGAMQDAHEFLVKLLDSLRDDSDHMSKSGSNPVDHNFKYELKEMYTCNQCGHVVTSKQPNNIVSLNLRRVRNLVSVQNLQDVIEYNFQKETVQYDCAKCNHKVSIRSVVFEQLPRVLVLHLKRYRQQGKELTKTDMALQIPQFVTLLHQADKSARNPNSPRPFCANEKETPPMGASNTPRSCPISKRLFSVGDKENQGPDDDAELGTNPLNWPLSEGKCDTRVSVQPVMTVGLKGGQPQLCATKHSNIIDTTERPLNSDGETSHNRPSDKFAEVPQTEEEEEEWLKRALQQSLQDVPAEPKMNGGKPMGGSDSTTVLDAEDDIEDIDLDQTETHKELLRLNCKSGELNHSYQLSAVVAHNGSMECGHFLTYVRHEEDKWWHFSDENVSEVTEANVSERTERSGYIVVYTYKST